MKRKKFTKHLLKATLLSFAVLMIGTITPIKKVDAHAPLNATITIKSNNPTALDTLPIDD